jgi:predicted DNA-binding transcriptional regulator AlpA
MPTAIIINQDELKETLSGISKDIISGMFEEIKSSHPPAREVMTLTQLADYWQVTKQSIINWVKRDEFPLPVHYVGGDPRFHLSEINAWSKMEGLRRLNKEDVSEVLQ